MILLLGASGFIGKSFATELRRRGHSFIPLTRQAFDYSRFDFLFDYLRTMKPAFVINAAGYPGAASASTAPAEREKMMAANAILPQMIARACSMTRTPWGHVSSGDIYVGAKVLEDGAWQVETDLSRPDLQRLYAAHPEQFLGFTELDEPNFTFRNTPFNFYSGTKALAEETIRDIGQSYIWRPRLFFNERQEPCNALICLAGQPARRGQVNSLAHVEDFVKASLDLWEISAPFGIYNITNPGAVTTREVTDALESVRPATRPPVDEPGTVSVAPLSNCILDVRKLLKTGVKIRPVADALKDAFEKMRHRLRPPRSSPALAWACLSCFLSLKLSH
jgi:dTDP-4-dehydrorhamnose reductase